MLNSLTSKERAESYTGGSSNRDLGLTRMCSVVFPLPILSEQRRIAAYLDSLQANVRRVKESQAQTVAEIDALLPSVLDKAFKGERRLMSRLRPTRTKVVHTRRLLRACIGCHRYC